MTSRNWPICSSDSSITSCPVTAVKPSGRTVLAASASSVWLTPSAAVRLTVVKASSPSRKRSCAALVSSSARVAPAVPPPLKLEVPTSSNVWRSSPVGSRRVTSSPTS